jgi:TPR repeat protein
MNISITDIKSFQGLPKVQQESIKRLLDSIGDEEDLLEEMLLNLDIYDDVNLSFFKDITNITNSRVAQNLLAIYYKHKKPISKKEKDSNNKQAFIYWKKAADQGLTEAMYNVAHCYHMGLGTCKSIYYAEIYYKKAYKQGHRLSFLKLKYLTIR